MAHQNVLLERMEKQFFAFGEGQILLTEKVDRVHAELKSDIENVATEVAVLKTEVGGLKTEMGGLKTEMGEVKERLGRVEELLLKALKGIKSLENRVGALESKWDMFSAAASLPKDFEERFRLLEQRVVSLESHVA